MRRINFAACTRLSLELKVDWKPQESEIAISKTTIKPANRKSASLLPSFSRHLVISHSCLPQMTHVFWPSSAPHHLTSAQEKSFEIRNRAGLNTLNIYYTKKMSNNNVSTAYSGNFGIVGLWEYLTYVPRIYVCVWWIL